MKSQPKNMVYKKKIMNDIKVWKTKTIRIQIDNEIQIENIALQIAFI